MVNSFLNLIGKQIENHIMKSNDLQQLKPVYIHEASYSVDNEISLVDLAVVLVRRKKMIAIIITLVLTITVIITILIPNKYTFSTSVEIGSQLIDNKPAAFESPETLLAKLQHSYIQQVLSEYRLANPEDKTKYKITVSVPTNSIIIVIETIGIKEDAKILTGLLSNLVKKIIQDHARIFDNIKTNLTSLRNQAKSELDLLSTEKDYQIEKRRLLLSTIEIQESALANLRNTREISTPINTIDPTGPSKMFVIAIAVIMGIIIAVFAAFFAEFITRVKEKSHEYRASP